MRAVAWRQGAGDESAGVVVGLIAWDVGGQLGAGCTHGVGGEVSWVHPWRGW